jgi:hypothetical protein
MDDFIDCLFLNSEIFRYIKNTYRNPSYSENRVWRLTKRQTHWIKKPTVVKPWVKNLVKTLIKKTWQNQDQKPGRIIPLNQGF